MDDNTKYNLLQFNIKAIETFLDIKFHGNTLQDMIDFVAEHHKNRVKVTTKLMEEAYEEFKNETLK